MTVLLIALGGAIGAALRYLTVLAVAAPVGTMAVNLLGSFGIGIAYVILSEKGMDRAMLFVMTGVLGGFTTFSAFSLDTLRLVEDGRVAVAGGYVMVTVLGCLLACWAGMAVARGLV